MGAIRKFLHYVSISDSEKEENKEIRILEKHLAELERLNEDENRRRETIRNKGNSIISVISIISGVVIALSIFIQKEAKVSQGWLIVFASITVAIGLAILSSMWNVYRLTSPENKIVMDPRDLNKGCNTRYCEYLKDLIKKNEEIFMKNKNEINRKVDFMNYANKSVLLIGLLFTIYTILILIWVCVRNN